MELNGIRLTDSTIFLFFWDYYDINNVDESDKLGDNIIY